MASVTQTSRYFQRARAASGATGVALSTVTEWLWTEAAAWPDFKGTDALVTSRVSGSYQKVLGSE